MTSIKQACLRVAVAGLVAGGGSAVAAAAANAEPSASDASPSTGASASDGRAAGAPARSRTRAAKPAAAATAVAARGTPKAGGAATATPQHNERSYALRRNTPSAVVIPSVAPPAQAVPTPAEPVPTDLAGPQKSGGTEVETAARTPAVPTTAVNAATTPRPAAAAAPPAQVPGVPVLPIPALPVPPVSAVTVNASATTTRRTTMTAAAAQVANTPTHVLLIGTDGTNLSKILEYTYDQPGSGFRAVMDEGVTGATSLVGHTTISGPSWSTVLTGAWDSKTGVINNLFDPAPYDAWPTAINLIEYNQPDVTTAVVANWRYINDMGAAGGYPADINEFVEFTNTWEDTDDEVAATTIDLINGTAGADSAFIFSYQVGVDEAGHAHGGDSPEYEAAVINTSENIKAILDTIDTWEAANPGQEWTVIVTTDHGHQPSVGFGHGFQSPAETSSFVIFDIAGDDSSDGDQNLAYSIADITPTIVDLFGIAQRSDFDGVPLQTRTTSLVDPGPNLEQTLDDAIAMYGYPDIGTDIALGARTVFASIPYFLDGFITTITDQLQAIVDQDIFLVSALAGLTELAVQFTGDVLVGVTQFIARIVATLTGSGVIAPNDPPLPAPPAAVLLDPAVLV